MQNIRTLGMLAADTASQMPSLGEEMACKVDADRPCDSLCFSFGTIWSAADPPSAAACDVPTTASSHYSSMLSRQGYGKI